MNDLPGVEALYEDVREFIRDTRALLESGRLLELSSLEKRVQMLCRSALEMKPEEQAKFAAPLRQLMDDLDALGGDLVAQRDAIGKELRGLSQHKKANTAYRIAESRDGYDPDKEQ